jgi:phage baseplate assembly protein W
VFSSYLNIPISFKGIKRKDSLDHIDVKKSIHNIIHLITTTEYEEVRHDPKFGCDIWQYDFENIYNPHSFKEELKKSIRDSIRNNEKRITNVRVDLQIEQVEITTRVQNKRIKTRIRLVVKGMIDETNEALEHQEMFFIGPLSY